MTGKPNIKSLSREQLMAALERLGEPGYRADQVLQWVYAKDADRFGQMTNLSAALRQKLADAFELAAVRGVRARQADDTTEKFLFQLADGNLIETVLIPATPGLTSSSDRHTVCVSTQVGCAHRCAFCASGLAGLKRNLTIAEIVDQVLQVRRRHGGPVDNIVVMGMGEPLANYEALLPALRIINAPWGLGIGARKITVSTVGLAPQIRRLAEDPLQVRLAISLHGATDTIRGQLMPVNAKYPLQELMAACEDYVRIKGRMLTFEYILMDGVNDGLDQARSLAQLARRLHAKVNLIPYNPVEGLPWRRPDRDRAKMFQHALRRQGIAATLRTEKGTSINAACGQLRLQTERQLAEAAPAAAPETAKPL